MGVGAENPTNAARAGRQDRLEMGGVRRARVDDSELLLADQVSIGARPGHDARIGCNETGYVAVELPGHARRQVWLSCGHVTVCASMGSVSSVQYDIRIRLQTYARCGARGGTAGNGGGRD